MTPKARTATRDDHETFCQTEGWTTVRDSRGRGAGHHMTFKLEIADGRILRTRISRPVDRTDYGKSMWSHILRDQLAVTPDEFWACVDNGTVPNRGGSRASENKEALPAELAHLLLTRVGLSEAEVASLTRAEAIAKIERFWTDRA